MAETDTDILKPIANIFSQRPTRVRKTIPLLSFVISTSLFYIYYGRDHPLYFSSFLLLMFLIAVILLKRYRDRKINMIDIEKGDYSVYEIKTEFRWDEPVDVVIRNLHKINESLNQIKGEFTILSIPAKEIGNMSASKKTMLSYLMVQEKTNAGIAEALRQYGIKLAKIDSDKIYKWISLSLNTSNQDGRNFIQRKEMVAVYLLNQRIKNSIFQLSRFIESLNHEVSAITSFRIMEMKSEALSRQTSKILSTDQIMKDKKISGGEEWELRKNAAKSIRKDESTFVYNVQISIVMKSDRATKLREIMDNVKLIANSWGFSVRSPDHRSSKLKKEVLFGGIMDYPQITSRAVSLLSFLNEPEEDGVVIGNDSQTNRPFLFNPFLLNSYNVLVIGETGSGKSYFGKIMVRRLMTDGRVKKLLVLDVLGEYDKDLWENAFNYDSDVVLVKTDDSNLFENLSFASEFMKRDPEEEKIILIEEAHVFINHSTTSELLVEMVKTSRHFKGSIILISQDSSDFTSDVGKKILNNSNSIFIFRNKLVTNLERYGIKPADFGYSGAQLSLQGGKNNPFSEALFYNGNRMRKIVIFPDSWEKEKFHSS